MYLKKVKKCYKSLEMGLPIRYADALEVSDDLSHLQFWYNDDYDVEILYENNLIVGIRFIFTKHKLKELESLIK